MSLPNIKITYEWPDDKNDLDTKTTFYFNQDIIITDENANAYLDDGNYIYQRTGSYNGRAFYNNTGLGSIYWSSGESLWVVERDLYSGISSEDVAYPWFVSSTGWSGDLYIYNLNRQPDPERQESVGYNVPGTYGNYSGDYLWQITADNTSKGPEIILVDIDKAYRSGVISDKIFIDCHADWFPGGGASGPASLVIDFNNKSDYYVINPQPASQGISPASSLVKRVEIPISPLLYELGLSGSIDYDKYTLKPINNFDAILDVNTGDLSIINTGVAVHTKKDVTFSLTLLDRDLNQLNTTEDIIENPYVQGIDVDILDEKGNIIYQNYISNSFQQQFTLTEEENINIFGEYKHNFGVDIKINNENSNIHNNKIFVYGNESHIDQIYVRDGSGYWYNEDPIGYQKYYPYHETEQNEYLQFVSDNLLYFPNYDLTLSGSNLTIQGNLTFGRTTQESLLIDWGDSNIDLIFQQNDGFVDGYSGSGVVQYKTDINNEYLYNLMSPTGIDGNYYIFSSSHQYSGINDHTKNIKLYYSGISSTGLELIKYHEFLLPHRLRQNGIKQIGDINTGYLDFDLIFRNDPSYTFFNRIDIYASDLSGVVEKEDNFIKSVPIISNTKNYNFRLEKIKLQPYTDYWFKLVPFSDLGKGHGWEIGPYNIYQTPPEISKISTQLLELTLGDATTLVNLVTGLIESSGNKIIDIIPKNLYHSYEYTTQFKDASGQFCSSKLMVVDNTVGLDLSRTGISFSEYAISDNSFIDYSISGDVDNIYLLANTDYPPSSYKLYKTSI